MNASHEWTAGPSPRRPVPRIRRGRSVALVDARFVEWLCEREDQPAPHRARWSSFAEHLLSVATGPTELVRSYWYASHGTDEVAGRLVHRRVLPDSADSGVNLVLSMARDLAALARNGACDQVLLVTDDDRLLTSIDAAQLQGLRVHLLAEPAAENMEELARSDASLAALLRQADSRIIASREELDHVLWMDGGDELPWEEGSAGLTDEHRPERAHGRRADLGSSSRAERPRPDSLSPEERDAMRQHLTPMVSEWWEDLPFEDQQELQAQLPQQRGLPQETDRQLLLRLSQSLGRSLRPPEKLLMRELARNVALGPAQGEARAPLTLAEGSLTAPG